MNLKQQYKDTTNGMTTNIISSDHNKRLRTFSIVMTAHWVPKSLNPTIDDLVLLDLELKKVLKRHIKNHPLWFNAFSNMDFKNTAFRTGAAYVELTVTCFLNRDTVLFNTVKEDVLVIRDLMLNEITPHYNFSERKLPKVVNNY